MAHGRVYCDEQYREQECVKGMQWLERNFSKLTLLWAVIVSQSSLCDCNCVLTLWIEKTKQTENRWECLGTLHLLDFQRFWMSLKGFKPLFASWIVCWFWSHQPGFLLMKIHVIALESIGVKKHIYYCLTEHNYLLCHCPVFSRELRVHMQLFWERAMQFFLSKGCLEKSGRWHVLSGHQMPGGMWTEHLHRVLPAQNQALCIKKPSPSLKTMEQSWEGACRCQNGGSCV